jgi:hypothetical protein
MRIASTAVLLHYDAAIMLQTCYSCNLAVHSFVLHQPALSPFSKLVMHSY